MSAIKLPINLHQRYDAIKVNGLLTAPLTIAPPRFKFYIDRTEFKKTSEDKAQLATLKAQQPKSRNHKFVTQFKGIF